MKMDAAQFDRFLDHIVIDENGCWRWQGRKNRQGYGCIGRHGITHRLAYEHWRGSLKPWPCQVIDHLCRVRDCQNPWHMEPVTIGENVLRGETITSPLADLTHCKHGHEFTPENTYVRPDRGEGRYRDCRQCRRDADQRRRSRERV